MKKHYKVISVILALVLLFSVVSITGLAAKSSFSDEVSRVASLIGLGSIFGNQPGSSTTTTPTDYTTKTDLFGFFGSIFEKICNFFQWIFSLIGLS